jgi:hypothetical protein
MDNVAGPPVFEFLSCLAEIFQDLADLWTTGDPFWLLDGRVKLKEDCAVSMACIAGFSSVLLRRSTTMERLKSLRIL